MEEVSKEAVLPHPIPKSSPSGGQTHITLKKIMLNKILIGVIAQNIGGITIFIQNNTGNIIAPSEIVKHGLDEWDKTIRRNLRYFSVDVKDMPNVLVPNAISGLASSTYCGRDSTVKGYGWFVYPLERGFSCCF